MSISEDRVPTGVSGLDPLIEGGFPEGSLILLAGNPGTGKTILGFSFYVTVQPSMGKREFTYPLLRARRPLFVTYLRF